MKRSSVIATMMMTLVFALVVVAVLIATGVFGAEQPKLVFSSADAVKEYDGTPLTSSEWQILSGELKEGHRAEVNVYGSQTDVGESRNLMTVKILDKKGKDVTKKYSIECQSGTLRVSAINITVMSDNLSKTYDGEPLIGNGGEIVSGNLLQNHKITIEPKGSQTDIGESSNGFEVSITDISTGENVTSNYAISPIYGKLTVEPIQLSILTGSASKDYDGYPLSYDYWENLSSDKLLDGHELLDVELLAQIKDPGSIPNDISRITVVDSDGNDVSKYYSFSTQYYGTLVINALDGPVPPKPLNEIKVSIKDQYHKYDGQPYSVENHYYVDDEEKDYISLDDISAYYIENNGLSYTYNLVCTATDIGFYEIELEFEIYNADGEKITDQFDVVIERQGLLQIYEVDVIITSASMSKPYDDTALMCNEYTLSAEIDADSRVEINFTGTIIDAGKIDNSFNATIVYSSSAERNPKYRVNCLYGTLEVTKRVISLTADSDMKAYDGTPLEAPGFTVDGDLLATHTVYATVEGSLTECGEVANTVDVETVSILNCQNKNVTNNYIIRYYDGKLIIYHGDTPPIE